MNERKISQMFRKPGKVRLNLDGGLDSMLFGNKRVSGETCKEMFRGIFGKEPTSLSSYCELANAALKFYGKEPTKYRHRNYD